MSSPAAGDKSIKFSIALDQDSVDKAKRAIASISEEVRKLVDYTKQAGGIFGGSGGATVGNSFAQPGMSGRQNAQNKAGGAAGSLTDGLTRAVQNSAQLFKSAASGSKDAFRIMSDGIKDHVRTADSEISKLESKLGRLGNAYNKLKERGANGGIVDAGLGSVKGQFFQTADQLDRARNSRAKLVKAQEDMEEANSPSIMGRLRGYFSNGKGGGGPGGGIFGAAMSGAGLGGVGTALSSPAGAVAGGVMLGSKIMNLGRDNQISNLNYAIDANMFRSDARANIGSLYGGNAQAIRNGDMARVHATRMMQDDPAFKNVVGSEYNKLLKQRRLVEGVPGGLGGLVDIAGQYVGSAANAVGLTSAGGAGSAITAQNDYLKRAASENALQTQTAQRMIENKMREDPGYSDRLNALYAGSTGNAGMLRSLGMGGGNVRVGGRNGHDLEQAGYIQARADAQMRDVGEFSSAFAGLSGSAGRGLAGHYESMLGPQTGGLSNVAQILGLGAQFGGGGWNGASALLGRGNSGKTRGYGVQGMIGRGGTDASAAVGLTGLGGNMMNSGALMEGGAGVMQTLLAAGYTGTPGGDMRMSNLMGSGVAAHGSMMNGSIDPLQQALNASAAMKAAKDAPYGAKWAMMHMDPAQKAEFERTGRVPTDMLGMGVTDKMLKSYLSLQTGGMFARVSSSMVGGKSGAELAKYKKSGNNFEYLRGKSLDEIQNSAKLLAPVLHMAGGAPTTAGALGSIRFSLASSNILTGGKGRGVHDTMRRNTAQARAAATKAELGVQDAAKNADAAEEQKKDLIDAPKQRNSNDSARNKALKALGPGADVQGSIEAVSAALSAFVNAVKRDMSPGGKAAAPR